LGVLTAVLWILLTPPAAAAASGFLPPELADMPAFLAVGWCFCRFVGYVIVTPAAEELAFRGYLTRRLISADFEIVPLGRFSWLSFFVSSALFGVFHGRSWFAGCLAGALFATALYRRGRIADAILAHATANAAIATYAIATHSWNVWS
jgi:CAAX prenyl protease-like protein